MRLYHTSDLHDRRGFVRRLDALRAEAPGLLFDCGDSLRGSQTVYRRREPVIAEIDAAHYDAQAMGNREFHYLFGAVRARAALMHHPLVCANLVDTKGRPLPFVPSLDFTSDDGAPVRVFGLLVPQYPVSSPWERVFGWRFRNPYEVAAEIANATPADTTLVALSHLGLRADRQLAARVGRLDLILGGHSHDTLAQPEVVNAIPIVHAGPYGKFVSRSLLEPRSDGARAQLRDFALVPLLAS